MHYINVHELISLRKTNIFSAVSCAEGRFFQLVVAKIGKKLLNVGVY